MDHFGGLDVSVKETSICIVDDTGRITKEVKVASELEALLKVLGNPSYRFKRIGLEAGPLSQWLFSALAESGLPVICVETRHMRAVLKAQIKKTGHGWEGEVRGAHQGAGRELPGSSPSSRTAAHCPARAARAVCHPAPPLAGHRAGRLGVPALN